MSVPRYPEYRESGVVGIGSTSSRAAPPCARLGEAFGERGPGRVPTIRLRRMVCRIDLRSGLDDRPPTTD